VPSFLRKDAGFGMEVAEEAAPRRFEDTVGKRWRGKRSMQIAMTMAQGRGVSV